MRNLKNIIFVLIIFGAFYFSEKTEAQQIQMQGPLPAQPTPSRPLIQQNKTVVIIPVQGNEGPSKEEAYKCVISNEIDTQTNTQTTLTADKKFYIEFDKISKGSELARMIYNNDEYEVAYEVISSTINFAYKSDSPDTTPLQDALATIILNTDGNNMKVAFSKTEMLKNDENVQRKAVTSFSGSCDKVQ